MHKRFERELSRHIRKAHLEWATEIKASALPRIRAELAYHMDSGANIDQREPLIDRMQNLIRQVTAQFVGRLAASEVAARILRTFRLLRDVSRADFERVLGRQTLGISNEEIEGVIRRSTRDTVDGIKGITEKRARSLTEHLTQGIVSGQRAESIANGLEKALGPRSQEAGNVQSEGKFLARNTVSRALGSINREQQTSAGISLYRWQTSEDERVRPTHRDLNGQIFSWEGEAEVDGVSYKMASDPGFRGGAPTIPGQPWNCRCVGLAYIPALDD